MISIIIPAYDEEESLAILYREIAGSPTSTAWMSRFCSSTTAAAIEAGQ